ncbi:MAG: hypothetical protein WC139_13290 [Candidatus Kapaibacterium sp.]
MEIKINCHVVSENQFECRELGSCHLFEGTDLFYRFLKPKKGTFREFIENLSDELHSPYFIGFLITDEFASEEAIFVHLQFNNQNGEREDLIIKNANIFITNKGQTIDKIVI